MTIDTEKQFAGNYVRLVNQVRELQGDLKAMTGAFDNSTQLNNKLHDEIILKDKMIYLILSDIYSDKTFEWAFDKFKTKALSELVAEQNKKAASCDSI